VFSLAECSKEQNMPENLPTSEVSMKVNGTSTTVVCEDRTLLVHAIREQLGLKGTRVGCLNGDCGACTIKMDGASIKSCLVLAVTAEGAEIVTIEGLAPDGELTDLQQAMWGADAFQCGFCTAGMLFASEELLEENASPTEAEIRQALIGNLCRCSGYVHMVDAVQAVCRARKQRLLTPSRVPTASTSPGEERP
jgi:aerobic-type carbon monoxide dehydrogenase small subunit (CoxS/CutS family)